MDSSRYTEIRSQMHQIFQRAFQWDRIPQAQIVGSAQKLGLWKNNTLHFPEEEDRAIFFEYCFYEKLSPQGAQIVQYTNENEEKIAASMTQSIHSLYEVVACKRESNEVILKDLLNPKGGEISMVDINLSHANAEEMIFYTRLLPFENHHISTGLVLTFSKKSCHKTIIEKEKIELKKRRKLSSPERYQWAFLSYVKHTRNS
ncbi:hypothetical protein K4L44_10805 [Halosquirtibacter laminarini]|uniref:Uncharacterized protein n=1 Tax=Halosquirtibacter laminarini TaxID=3374600 RepID=A0AC61NC38_9BACT|nr:hypothetical protein K4L44_10805 [Prolixibacteraceae bacterium]